MSNNVNKCHNWIWLHGYSLSGIGKTVQWASIDLLLLIFLTDILLIPVEVVAIMLSISLAWEVFIGFALSVLIEKFKHRIRKFSYFAFIFSFPSVLAYAALFTPPPAFIDNTVNYVLAVMLIFRLTYITIDIPNNTLMVTLTDSPNLRTKLSSLRAIYSAFASLLISVVIYLVFQQNTLEQQYQLLPSLVIITSIISLSTMLISAYITCQFEQKNKSTYVKKSTREVFRLLTSNKLLIIFISISMVSYLTFPIFLKSVPYYTKYIVGDASLSGVVFFCMTIAQIFTFHWSEKIARVKGKLNVLYISYICIILMSLLFILFQPRSDIQFTILCSFLGALIASTQMLLWAIVPDLIRPINAKSIHQSGAAAMGFFASVNKLMKGLAPILISFSYFLIDFEPNTTQSNQGETSIMLIMIIFPVLGSIASLIILKKYKDSFSSVYKH